MENDIVSLFLIRKKQNIYKYANIFLKYTLKNDIDLSKIVYKVIDIYVDNFYLEDNTDFSYLTQYFEVGNTKETLMKNVLLSAILFYKNNGLENQIKNDIKTIVILSNTIYLSLNADEYINEYNNSSINMDTRINNYFDIFLPKLKIDSDQIKDIKEELYNQFKKDINVEKKFWKTLVENNYNLVFKTDNKNNYLVDYYYNIKLLNRYEKDLIDRVSFTKGIVDDNLSIYLEKLSVVVLKDLLLKNYNDLFFINIYPDYFNKNKNIINLEKIINNKNIKSHIVFCFDINNIDDNINVIEYLKSKDCLLGINNINYQTKISINSFINFDYVFINNDILDKYKDYKEFWDGSDTKFILSNEYEEIEEERILERI